MNTSPSPTTTSMNLKDTPAVREPLQTDAMPSVASEGVKPLPGAIGTDNTTSGMNVGGSQVTVGPIKKVDFKDFKTGEDFRAPNSGAGVTDFAKNEAEPRGETTDTPEAGA